MQSFMAVLDGVRDVRAVTLAAVGIAALLGAADLQAQTADAPAQTAAARAQTSAALAQMRTDPAALYLPLAAGCRDCHSAEYDVWEQTRHASGFAALHRLPLARTIADAMDEPLIKRDSLCLRCHYTPALAASPSGGAEPGLQAGAGVSCQSCHGEARNWINVHYDFGIDGVGLAEARSRESAEHRTRRQAQMAAAGMVTGRNLVAMASACLDCHLVADDQLLERSRHPAGNPNFEFVSWVQSRIRHNFLDATLAGGAPVHAAWSIERQRVAYVVGRLVELEYALRALAATERFGRHARVYQGRVEAALEHLERIVAAAEVSAARQAVTIAGAVELAPGRPEPLLRAAEQVAAVSRTFADTNSGSGLQRIDPLIAEAAEKLPMSSRPCSVPDCAPLPAAPSEMTDGEMNDGETNDAADSSPEGGAPLSIRPLVVPRDDDAR